MAESKTTTRGAKSGSPRKASTSKAPASGFTSEERAAMRERAKELKAEAKAGARKEEGNQAVLAKLATMAPADRKIGEALHRIITETAPDLEPRLWYGMPAYAKDGKVLCFFQDAGKFKTRYGTLGFSDVANLDAGAMWPASFAITALGDAEEAKIRTLVRKAVK